MKTFALLFALVSSASASGTFRLQNCDPDTIVINSDYPGGLYSCTTTDGQDCVQRDDQVSCNPSFVDTTGCHTVCRMNGEGHEWCQEECPD